MSRNSIRFVSFIAAVAAASLYASCAQPSSSSSDGGGAASEATSSVPTDAQRKAVFDSLIGTWICTCDETNENYISVSEGDGSFVLSADKVTSISGVTNQDYVFSADLDTANNIKTYIQSSADSTWGDALPTDFDPDVAKQGWLELCNKVQIAYTFVSADKFTSDYPYKGMTYTRSTASSGTLPSGFDITSGPWSYNPTATSGGAISFSAGGTVTFAAATSGNSWDGATGTYTLSGSSLEVSISNGKSGSLYKSADDTFTISASGTSLTLTLSGTSSTTVGTAAASSSTCSYLISYLWPDSSEPTPTSVTLQSK